MKIYSEFTLHGPSRTLTISFVETRFLERSWALARLSILLLISRNLTSMTSGLSGTPLSTYKCINFSGGIYRTIKALLLPHFLSSTWNASFSTRIITPKDILLQNN